jgi:hypothetical protein
MFKEMCFMLLGEIAHPKLVSIENFRYSDKK